MIHFFIALFFSIIFIIFLNPKALLLLGYDTRCANFLYMFCAEMITVYWICVIESFLQEKVFLPIRILLYIFIFSVAVYLCSCFYL